MPLALNVGDGLFALAHLAMARLVEAGTSAARSLAATEILDKTSMALIQGQYLDVAFESRLQVAQRDYVDMVAGKTAALFACSTQLGAMLTSDDTETVEHYRRYGHNLGLAFQMTDDILGIWGDPKLTGKPRASDVTGKKKTLPIIYALEKSPTLVEIYRRDHIDEKSLETVFSILDEVEALHYAQSIADEYKNRALGELDATGRNNRAQDHLTDLAHFLTKRDY
jgi:geranylgeranyl diphosphate synthase type I